jgi:hypothetical protein
MTAIAAVLGMSRAGGRSNNRRAEYLSLWWDVMNWSGVSERYQEALAK